MEKFYLQLLVVGDDSNGQGEFIKRFLGNYEVSAEMERETDYLNIINILKKRVTVWLRNVEDINIVKNLDYETHGIVFCYSSSHLQSFKNLEKHWISPLKSKSKYCFLVDIENYLNAERDDKNQKQRRQVSEAEAKNLKDMHELQQINKPEKFDNIMETFFDRSFLEKYCRRQSIDDLCHQEEPAQVQPKPKVPRKPYIKKGKQRSIY